MPATDYFSKTYQRLTTTLAADKSSGASSMSLSSATNFPTTSGIKVCVYTLTDDGDIDTDTFCVYRGTVSASQVNNLTLVEGTDQLHTAGATVSLLFTATHWNDAMDGILAEHNQDGTHSDVTATTLTTSGDITSGGTITADSFETTGGGASVGWNTGLGTISASTGYNNGNRSFTLGTSTDLTSILSPGMRFKIDRSVAAPTQCADLESSSSQYASKSSPTGITFTDDFTCEAWVKLESYTAGYIVSRYSTDGWGFFVNASGQLSIFGNNASSDKLYQTYQSLPLNRWVHVAASLDLSGSAAEMYIDGVLVPDEKSGSGTATSIVQAGNLQVGALAGASFFDGKIADVRVWSTIRTQTEIRDNMYKQLVGNETNLVAYFKLNGDFNDSTSNANNLTASGGAVATDADNPFSDTEYGIVTAVTASTLTVFTPTGSGIPLETLASPFYSTQSAPFGFPRDTGRWIVQFMDRADAVQNSPTSGTYYNLNSEQISIPMGVWDLEFKTPFYLRHTASTTVTGKVLLSTTTSSETHDGLVAKANMSGTSGTLNLISPVYRREYVELSASTVFYLLVVGSGTLSAIRLDNNGGEITIITATCAYL